MKFDTTRRRSDACADHSIEYPRDLDAQPMLPPIVEEQRFGAAFTFIITRSLTDRIDVTPVVFGLRMDMRIAIDFGRRGLENLCFHAFGKPQHVDRAVHARFGRLHWVMLVVNGRCRARQIVNLVDLHIVREGDVMANEFKVFVADEMFDIHPSSGEEIIEAEDAGILRRQVFAQMRTEKA